MFRRKEKKLQKGMEMYNKKMQKLNRQFDNLNAEVKLKSTELRKIGMG